MISSTTVYNAAVLELMKLFGWKRISLIRDTVDAQHTGTAKDFEDRIGRIEEFHLLLRGEITEGFQIGAILRELRNHESRIIYASVPKLIGRELLCTAYQEDIISPGFVWLFHDLSLDDFISPDKRDSCSTDQLLEAIDGAFFLNYRLEPEDEDQFLISGQTYREYRQVIFGNSSQNLYANAMHDSVWAFALALNKVDLGMNQQGYPGGNLTKAIRKELADVDFIGTTGHVRFNSTHQVIPTEVEIRQIRNQNPMLVAVYDPVSETLIDLDVDGDVPQDRFDHTDERIPRSLPILTLVFTSILILLTTVILIFYLIYWKDPAIKATSPVLGLVILTGCYLLYIGTLLTASREYGSGDAFTILCSAEVWFGTLGVQMIFATLLVRLLRVYRIFFLKKEQKIGKLWSDNFLLLAIAAMVFVVLFLLILWTSIHPFTIREEVDFQSTSNPPRYNRRLECSSNNSLGWIVTILLYIGLTIIAVLILAIKTRKIEMDSFKDTKKVSAFIYSMLMVFLTCIPLAAILIRSDIPEAAFAFRVLTYLVIATLCIVFLFLSKIISAMFHLEEPRSKTTSRRSGPTSPSPRTPRHTGNFNSFSEPSPAARSAPTDRRPSIPWPVDDVAVEGDLGGFRIFDLTVGDIVEYCSCCGGKDTD